MNKPSKRRSQSKSNVTKKQRNHELQDRIITDLH